MFSIHSQLVAMLIDAGFKEIVAATAFGVSGLMGFFGMLVFGFSVDRINRLGTVLASYAMSTCGILLLLSLLSTGGVWLLWLFVFLFGPTLGVRGPVLSATAASVFGRNAGLGGVVGAMFTGGSLGGAIGATVGGLLRDHGGGHGLHIAFAAILVSIPALMFVLVPELREGRAIAAGSGNCRSGKK